MKTILALASLFAVCVANTLPAGVLENMSTGGDQSPYYQRYYEYPDEEGNIHIIDVEAPLGPEAYEADFDTRNAANNQYFLYTRRNPVLSQTLIMNNANSITSSNFNPNLPTVVISHGWLSSRHSEPNPTLRTTYFAKSDCNVIVLDWNQLAANSLYNVVSAGVPAIGLGMGQFINFLVQTTGANLSDFHLIGFSLGAHVVGNAGRALGGRVARVTGLDPAGPLWEFNSNRLSSTDGIYVEAIHTDGGYSGLGISNAIAHADFYPNGGSNQPGCYTFVCNHNRAWELFAASVTHDHLLGRQCSSTLQITWNTCNGVIHRMGNDDLRKWGIGMYRLDTGRSYPY